MNAFRAHQSAAPLKQPLRAVAGMVREFLPCSPERGPVEAESLGVPLAWLAPAFRAHQSAAPLKRFPGVRCRRRLQNLPCSPERGPVEA